MSDTPQSIASRYIVLPDFGFRGDALRAMGQLASNGRLSVERRPGESQDVQILSQIEDDGPKLVEMSSTGELALRRKYGSRIQIVPLMHYEIPRPYAEPRILRNEGVLAAVAASKATVVRVVDSRTLAPLVGARVIAFTRFRSKVGDDGSTDSSGMVQLAIPHGMKIERLYVYPPDGYWGHFRTGAVGGDIVVDLKPIDFADARHSIQRIYGGLPGDAGAGVTVGIIDTGIDDSHHSLGDVQGRNLVFDELQTNPASRLDFQDVHRHGTHVAGIVASRRGTRGVAPGVALRAYRVFPKAADENATNFDIARAITAAVSDDCDIINLSLGGLQNDPVLRKAVEEAARHGVLVVAAAGNDYGENLLYPARYEQAIAVTAIGLRDTCVDGSLERADMDRPYSPQKPNVFLAAFTNVGPLSDLTAPGVGIVSTVPGNRFAVMSGTSMAAPVVSGFAAHLLTSRPELVGQPRTPERRNDLIRALYRSAFQLDLGRFSEGFGVPLPSGGEAALDPV